MHAAPLPKLDQVRTSVVAHSRPDAIFRKSNGLNVKVVRVLVNGRDSGVRMPDGWKVTVVGHDRAGHLYGNLTEAFDNFAGNLSIGFTTEKGIFHLVPPPSGFMSSRVSAVGSGGDYIGIWQYPAPFQSLDARYLHVPHGFYVNGAKPIDLGPADTVRFSGPGIIEGEVTRERSTHRYIGIEVGGESETESFRWVAGKRTVTRVKNLP